MQFQAHAVADGSGNAETPMEVIVHVIDQNDNSPVFTNSTYLGEVAEASPKGTAIGSKPEKKFHFCKTHTVEQ